MVENEKKNVFIHFTIIIQIFKYNSLVTEREIKNKYFVLLKHYSLVPKDQSNNFVYGLITFWIVAKMLDYFLNILNNLIK